MTAKRANRIGIISTFILSTIGVFLCISFFRFWFIEAGSAFGSTLRLWDIVPVVTLIVALFTAKEIGKVIIVEKPYNDDVQTENAIFLTVSISMTISILFLLGLDGFFNEFFQVQDGFWAIALISFSTLFFVVCLGVFMSKIFGGVLLFILKLYQ